MDRDRDRDRRPLDIPPEDQYGTGRGQSYRPGGARDRTPPRTDTYRARSPPRRNDYGDSYRASRPRSRTPPRREEPRRRSPSPQRFRDRDGGGDSYRGRPRSPPRREDLPRDDLFRKEPARDTRDVRDERSYRDEREYGRDDRERDRGYTGTVTRSPPRYRDRSPVPLKRGRDASPGDSRDRRLPPTKRERLESPTRGRYEEYPPSRVESPPRRRFSPETRERRPSPRAESRDYRQRSRSPLARNERGDARTGDDWRRPRSPSPQQRYAKQDYYSGEENGGSHSVATSRRSSPPVHPSRLQQVDDRSGRPTPRDPYDNREPYRARSPPESRPSALRDREYSEDQDYASADDRIPPPREPYPADDQPAPRAPPTGPAVYRATSANAMAPPTGPSAANVSISAHARSPVVPPSGPRAASGPMRGDFGTPRGRGGYRGDFGSRGGFGSPAFRGGRIGAPPGPQYGRGGAPVGPSNLGRSESFDRDVDPSVTPTSATAPPAGPRNSFSQAAPPPFRSSNNTTATTYPRTQRFGPNGQPITESTTPTGPRAARRPTEPAIERGPHPAIADLAKPIEGGQKMEPLFDRTKLDKLQEEAERLRRIIDEKEAKKRKGLREWERLSRETEAAAFRSQVAEEALRNASGEAESAAAF